MFKHSTGVVLNHIYEAVHSIIQNFTALQKKAGVGEWLLNKLALVLSARHAAHD